MRSRGYVCSRTDPRHAAKCRAAFRVGVRIVTFTFQLPGPGLRAVPRRSLPRAHRSDDRAHARRRASFRRGAGLHSSAPMYRTLAPRTRRWIDLALGKLEPSDPGERRHARVAQGALSALGARSVGLLAGLAIVPLTLSYLGQERYGVWITISTTVAWLQLADLGIGNGLTNALAGALASDRADRAQEVVSTAFWALAGTAALLGATLAAAWRWVDWASLFNVHSPAGRTEIPLALAIAAALYLAGFPLALVDRIYAATLEGP